MNIIILRESIIKVKKEKRNIALIKCTARAPRKSIRKDVAKVKILSSVYEFRASPGRSLKAPELVTPVIIVAENTFPLFPSALEGSKMNTLGR